MNGQNLILFLTDMVSAFVNQKIEMTNKKVLKRALIIEDEPGFLRLLHAVLERMGIESDGTNNGPAAFQMLQKRDYDIIISDIDMPDVNGMEVNKYIDKYFPHLINRIIFATGNSFNGNYRNFFQSIQCPVLFKPFELDELRSAVQLIVE